MKINMIEEIKKVSQEPYNTSELYLYPVFVNIGIASNVLPDKEYEFDPIICMNTVKAVSIVSQKLFAEFANGDYTYDQQIKSLEAWCLFAGVGIANEVLICGNSDIISGMDNIINPKGISCMDDFVIKEIVSHTKLNESAFRDHAVIMGEIAFSVIEGSSRAQRLDRILNACRAMFIYGTIIAKEYIAI